MRGYNVVASSLVHPSFADSSLPELDERHTIKVADIFRPALTLPMISSAKVTQTQAALHLLCCLDSLSRCQQIPMQEKTTQNLEKSFVNRRLTKEDFIVVNRFESMLLRFISTFVFIQRFFFSQVMEVVGAILVIQLKQFDLCRTPKFF